MRTPLAGISALIASTAPAAADCYWANGEIWCTPGCRVVDRWWDGQQQWMQYSCFPPIEVLVVAGIAVLVVIAIVGAIASAASAEPPAQDIQQIAADTAKTNELWGKYKALEQETQAHIAAMRKRGREGESHE